MRYMMCAAAMMLLAIATTGCQFAGSSSGCADCGRGSSPMMGDPGCSCDSNGCAGRGLSAKGNGKGTLLSSLFGTGSGSACQNGACGGSRGGCNGNCNGGGMNGAGMNGAGMNGAGMNGSGMSGGAGMNGSGMHNGLGAGMNMNGAGMNGGFGGGMNGPGMNGGGGDGFTMAHLQGCNHCMSQGRPCAGCLAPGGRLANLIGAAHGPHCGPGGCVCGLAQGVVNRIAGHDCQTPYTVPYAQGGMGMGGPGAGGPVPTYGYPYYTTRAPRDFLMANPPSIGP